MENPPPLTPRKIQRLMYLAEDKSFNTYRSGNFEIGFSAAPQQTGPERSSGYESSSGILDLDECEGFGESGMGSVSLSKSTAFHAGEMTGRSTGADDVSKLAFQEYGRYSVSGIDDYEKKLNQQTNDVQEIMRQSIASGYSFHSKRDLTADESSFVMREAPLPVPKAKINMHLQDSIADTNIGELSMGAYFKNRCQQFGEVLPRNDSPQYDVSSLGLSMAEDSLNMNLTKDMQMSQCKELSKREPNNLFQMDMTLDCVPVRQPRVAPTTGKPLHNNTFTPISPAKENRQVKGPAAAALRPYAAKQANFLLDPSRNHLSTSLRPVTEDSKSTEEYDSLSLSRIANILEKESDVSVAAFMKHMGPQYCAPRQPDKPKYQKDVHVVYLKDTKKTETASSAGTVDTVINMGKLKLNDPSALKEVPQVVLTQPAQKEPGGDSEVKTEQRATRSKSPSSKSRSTMSTVQENVGYASFKSGDSPMHSSGGKPTHVLSPNIEYKELDKSINWDDVMQMKGRSSSSECLAKEPWAHIQTRPVKGFVGVSTSATISITSQSENWLTARLDFPDQQNKISIDLPRSPLLLAPAKTEQCTVQITSNVEMTSNLHFTLYLKDSSVNGDQEIEGTIEVDVKMPSIQAVAADGVNKVCFPPTQEGRTLPRSLVLISDCSVDLKLELLIKEGAGMFRIYNVQEIRKSDVTKELIDNVADGKQKFKTKGLSKQLCKLSSGNAIKVTLVFSSTKIADVDLSNKLAVFNGCLDVNLIGINAVLKKVDLIASVGRPQLAIALLGKPLQADKVHLTSDVTCLTVSNTGSIAGMWRVVFKDVPAGELNYPFKVSASQLLVEAGQSVNLKLAFIRPDDSFTKGTLIFEDVITGAKTALELTGGKDKPKAFPIKTSCSELSWVQPGKKEISLKNITNKKLHIKCRIKGEGFYIDCDNSGVNSNMHVTINANECRPLPVMFRPTTNQPCKAYLHMAYEQETEISRKVALYGCASGDALQWSGMVTYGDNMALVRALSRQPVELKLVNKSPMPAFVAASVHFNMQYVSVAATSRLEGARRIVPGKGSISLILHVDWARVERRARTTATTTLAAVTVLTGAEFTRRRILKVLKQGSEGALDVSSLPSDLQALAGPFESEDPYVDNLLKDFDEAKNSLEELVGGIHELTAQIDMPRDLAEDNTILITDDTILDHHTLCE